MNPQVKKIGNKLFDKVELESQKVELASLSYLSKLSTETKNKLDLFNKSNNDTINLAKITLKAADDYETQRVKMYDLMKQIEKQFKELGLDVLTNQEFKIAVDIFSKDREVERQKGYLRQII
jgi:formyltetrahydrofolate synthetase